MHKRIAHLSAAGRGLKPVGRLPRSEIDGIAPVEIRRATLTIGRGINALRDLVGHRIDGQTLGDRISEDELEVGEVDAETVTSVVLRLRSKQVGRNRAGATVFEAQGTYPGYDPEKTVRIEIRADDAEGAFFEDNIKTLAQWVALNLAQEIVLIDFEIEREHSSFAATPMGWPAPGADYDALLRRLRGGA